MQNKDHQRTTYHYQPPAYWMNDPNGLVQWQGIYHLFYQYNPDSPLHGNIHWGHTKSADLVHWADLPIALAPTPGGPDEGGCWSGCFVDNQGTPTLVYSGNAHGRQLPCLATSNDDDLVTWEKYPGNPVITAWPSAVNIVEFRDHCVWKDGDDWYQLIGSGIQGVGGTALLYRSSDLINWDYLHPLCIGNKDETGTMWECPDFFPLGDKYVLTISSIPHGLVYYFIGSYQNLTFTPEQQGVLDASPAFYAPQSFRDEQGRRIVFGWLREGRDDAALQAAGWAGVMSLPRILSLHDGKLAMEPAAELTRLRQRHQQIAPQRIEGQQLINEQFTSNALEILMELEYSNDSHCGICLQDQGHPDELLQISMQATGISVAQTAGDQQSAEQCVLEPGRHTLHIFIDGSVLEIFIDNRQCFTQRFYHSAPQQLNLNIFCDKGAFNVRGMDIWELQA